MNQRAFFEFGGVAAAVLAVASLVLSLAGHSWNADARRLAREGVEIDARVLDLWFEQAGESLRTSEYLVRFTFTAANGETVEEEVQVTRERYAGLVIGGALPLRHVPEEPGIFEIESGSTDSFAEDLFYSGLGLAGLGIIFAGYAGHRAQQAAYARRAGRTVEATVVGYHWALRNARTGQPVFARIVWRFRDAEGRRWLGFSSPFNFYEVRDYPLGTPVTVHFDPERPQVSFWSREV